MPVCHTCIEIFGEQPADVRGSRRDCRPGDVWCRVPFQSPAVLMVQTGKMNEQPWSKSQVYEIRFWKHLDLCRAQMFEGLKMVREPGGETVLTGPVLDQAALHGVLNRIRDLGVPLLSVKRLSAEEANAGRDAAP
jgi:hypothetical protein